MGGSYFLASPPAFFRRLFDLRSHTKSLLSEALLSRSVASASESILDTTTRFRRGRLLLKSRGEAMTDSLSTFLRPIKGLFLSESDFFPFGGSWPDFGSLSASLASAFFVFLRADLSFLVGGSTASVSFARLSLLLLEAVLISDMGLPSGWPLFLSSIALLGSRLIWAGRLAT